MGKIREITLTPKLVTIVDFTMYDMPGKEYFFDKKIDQITEHLTRQCETVVILNVIEIEAVSVVINGIKK